MAQQAPMPGLAEILQALPSLKVEELRILKHRMDHILQKDILLYLPQELQLYILQELRIDDIGACVNVSRSWRNLMQQESVVTTLSRIHYPGLHPMLQCRYDPRVAVTGNKPDQGAREVSSTVHRRAFFRALQGNTRRRHGMFSSLYSHRWWHRSDPDEADGVERLLPADEWRGHFVLPNDPSEIFWRKDITKYRRAPLPSPMPANLPPPEPGKAKYHSGRLALQFDNDDPRGRFVVDYLFSGVRRRFQPPAQQVGSCNLLALGDTLMVCGRGNRLYVYNLLQPEQPCHSLRLPGLIDQDCIATAGAHVVGMLSFHGSVKMFDWTADGRLCDYEVSEPTEYALEACGLLELSHKPKLVAHPFAKGVMYLIFGGVPTNSGRIFGSHSRRSSPELKTVVFEIVDRHFQARFMANSTPPIGMSVNKWHMPSIGTPTDSHGSIFLGGVEPVSEPNNYRWDDPGFSADVKYILLTFNIFTRTFTRIGVWHLHFCYTDTNIHYWDGLCATFHDSLLKLHDERQLSLPYIIPASMILSEQTRYNRRIDPYLSKVRQATFIRGIAVARVPIRCFPRLSPEQRESPAARKYHPCPHPENSLEERIFPAPYIDPHSLYALVSDVEYNLVDLESPPEHRADGTVTIFGDADFLIYMGATGYAAWCFAPEGGVPKEAEKHDQQPELSLTRRNHQALGHS
ncbi:hypothetical protein RB595_004425 [Gaeumannomyces hyphopodioides]